MLSASKFRKLLIASVVFLFVVLVSSSTVARVYTDWLWYGEVGQQPVWSTTFRVQILLALAFGGLFLAMLWPNMFLAERKTIRLASLRPEEEFVRRYQETVGPYRTAVRAVVMVLFAVIAGSRTAGQWQNWLLFRNGGSFDRQDPLFGNDAGFYVFRLPFISFVVGWLFAAVLFTTLLVVVLYYVNGQIRLSRSFGMSSEAKLHISILLAVMALVRAGMYWIDRYALLYSDRQQFTGALATDVNIALPGLYLLSLISVVGAGLIVWNTRREGWGLPMVVCGLWLLSHVLVVGILPAIYQNLRVEPQEVQQESTFIERNIEATRFGHGLDGTRLAVEQYEHENELDAEEVERYDDVLRNVPIADRELTSNSFSVLQGEGVFYQFSPFLDIDRYMVDGEVRPVVLSARGLNVDEVDANWERRHVSFTHGYGLALASGFEVDGGRPSVLVGALAEEVPVDERLDANLAQPRIYFGEDLPGYAVVGARGAEVDFKSQNQTKENRYDGSGGVSIGSLSRQLAFSIRFRELNPLISENVQDSSKVIFNRDINVRVRELAPFLRWDSDPYPVLAEDGQIYWMLDGYTASSQFPYSQKAGSSVAGSELSADDNYIRGAVKATVNAHSGEVSMYVVDDQEPILAAWREVFPSLFDDLEAMPTSLQEHLRYPSDLFTIQSDLWGRYHVSDVTAFIQNVNTWSVARQPSRDASSGNDTSESRSMDPQYLMARLPGDAKPQFVLQRAFIPRRGQASSSARPKIEGMLVAHSDGEDYGKLTSFEITGDQPNAPELVHSDIQKVEGISRYVSRISENGSDLKWGPMTMVMLDNTFVFVRPVYILSDSQQSLPILQNVIAVSGEKIAMRPTLDAAIDAALAGAPPWIDSGSTDPGQTSETSDTPTDPVQPGTGETEDPPAEDPPDDGSVEDPPIEDPSPAEPESDYDPSGKSIVELLADADRLLAEAEAADERGDTEEARSLRADSRRAVAEAQRLIEGGASP